MPPMLCGCDQLLLHMCTCCMGSLWVHLQHIPWARGRGHTLHAQPNYSPHLTHQLTTPPHPPINHTSTPTHSPHFPTDHTSPLTTPYLPRPIDHLPHSLTFPLTTPLHSPHPTPPLATSPLTDESVHLVWVGSYQWHKRTCSRWQVVVLQREAWRSTACTASIPGTGGGRENDCLMNIYTVYCLPHYL